MSGAALATGVGAAAIVADTVMSSNNGAKSKTGPQFGVRDTINTQTTDQTTSTLNPETLAMLQSLVIGGDFSKSSAIRDSSDAVTAAIQEVMQKYMPTIASNAKGSGMMGDSMSQILANQTSVQAAVQGGAVKMNAINSYASSLDNFINSLIAGSPQKVKGSNTNNTTERTAGSATSSTSTPGLAAAASSTGDTIAKLIAANKVGGDNASPTYMPVTGGGSKSTYGAKSPDFSEVSSSGNWLTGLFGG